MYSDKFRYTEPKITIPATLALGGSEHAKEIREEYIREITTRIVEQMLVHATAKINYDEHHDRYEVTVPCQFQFGPIGRDGYKSIYQILHDYVPEVSKENTEES